MSIVESEVRDFLREYEAASATHDFSNVADLIHPHASCRFREGDFVGIEAIRMAFEKTWSAIHVDEERYSLTDATIVHTDVCSASVSFTFN